MSKNSYSDAPSATSRKESVNHVVSLVTGTSSKNNGTNMICHLSVGSGLSGYSLNTAKVFLQHQLI